MVPSGDNAPGSPNAGVCQHGNRHLHCFWQSFGTITNSCLVDRVAAAAWSSAR
jgi:hypothetical protein